MTNAEVVKVIAEVVGEVVGVDASEIRGSDSGETILGWDLTTHVTILMELEERFGVTFDVTRIGELRSIEELAEEIRALKKQ